MKIVKLSLFLLLVTALLGCGDEKPRVGKYGMMDPNIPEYAAVEFFDHIYHDENLTEALKLASPSLERLIKSYNTNKNVQRHILNLRFDKVEITPHAGSAGRNEFSKETKIFVFFEGQLNGNVIKDMRIVDLVRIDDKWKVDKISLK
ncbi:hypothetical protein [Paraglaciecola hydrolytica]|uniref:DUF4878 domain-containing protein n=1 Tax=Paraglaciecola hydrolytica TaxID=1799789 RepID=A0A136A6D3_9ALTE|nr:hypothetical protein [Paraglaciecola hydrolytica]KXI30795.1 hypothetical protein AX660_05135 [Paraglaciecola hydrolytica]